MNYFELIKKYAEGKGEKTMWASTMRVSEFVEAVRDEHPEEYEKLIKGTYEELCGPHYNEGFAMVQIEKMAYKDKQGNVHHAPHWTKEQYRASFDSNKARIRDGGYTCWDWAVTLEMMLCDYACVLRAWFPSATEEEIKAKVPELALAFLNDYDDESIGKIWRRFNG